MGFGTVASCFSARAHLKASIGSALEKCIIGQCDQPLLPPEVKMYELIDFRTNEQINFEFLEDVVRDLLIEYLQTLPPIDFIKRTEIMVKFSILGFEKRVCSELFPVTLCEDIFDLIPITTCITMSEEVFSVIENILTLLVIPHKTDPKVGRLKFITLIVHLLHRFSRAMDPMICGRLFLVAARRLDIFDRSGTNSRGLVNRHSEYYPTELETQKTSSSSSTSTAVSAPMEIDSEPKVGSFHHHFMVVQKRVRASPLQSAEKSQSVSAQQTSSHWKPLLSSLEVILSAIESNPLKPEAPQPDSTSLSSSSSSSSYSSSSFSSQDPLLSFICKFFSNPDALSLQIESAEFRVVFLCQMIFYLEHMIFTTNSSSVKLTTSTWKIPQDITKQVDVIKQRIIKNLRSSLPPSSPFLRTILATVDREKSFIKWKNEGCDGFGREAVPIAAATKKRKPLTTPAPTADKRYRLGTPQLDELWNIAPNNLECFKDDAYNHVPDVKVSLSFYFPFFTLTFFWNFVRTSTDFKPKLSLLPLLFSCEWRLCQALFLANTACGHRKVPPLPSLVFFDSPIVAGIIRTSF